MIIFIVHALAYPTENQYNHAMRLHHNRLCRLLPFNITTFFKVLSGFFSPWWYRKGQARKEIITNQKSYGFKSTLGRKRGILICKR